MIRGNLTPKCAAAVRAVLEALGKKAAPEDDRTEGKRFHNALQLACVLREGSSRRTPPGRVKPADCRRGALASVYKPSVRSRGAVGRATAGA